MQKNRKTEARINILIGDASKNCDRGAAFNEKYPSENRYFNLGRFDELRQGGGVEWKNPSENQKKRGPNGDQQSCVDEGGGPTGKGVLLIGIVIEVSLAMRITGLYSHPPSPTLMARRPLMPQSSVRPSAASSSPPPDTTSAQSMICDLRAAFD